MTETERAIEIIEARLPLYTDIGQINALRECISSIRSASRSAEAGKPVVKLVAAARKAQERMLVEGYRIAELDEAIAAFNGGADV